jgi:anaerobic ribonucleoside-triphosphate reductase activating protein
MMRYKNYSIVLQEIPDEVSLCFTITGCNLRCDGCHSPFLWKSNNGTILSIDLLTSLLDRYKYTISCVLFMGGEWYKDILIEYFDSIKKYNIKTALYTGLELNEIDNDIIQKLDYIKYGRWISEKGGLDSKNTNQQLINLHTNEKLNYKFYK